MPGRSYPYLIEASGHCPPEDIGGPWGYAEFLEAIQDPKHKRYEELSEWVEVPFDPNDAANMELLVEGKLKFTSPN